MYHRLVQAEILTIGDELCRGEVVDTNSSWLAEALWDLGVTVTWMTSCCDVEADISRAVREAAERADLVLVSGGLGPTRDDLTVETMAQLTGVEPVIHEPSRARMEDRYRAAGRDLIPSNFKQVQIPAGAVAMSNPTGMAPGFETAVNGAPVVCMPGVPHELKAIFNDSLRDRIVALRDSRGDRIERIARRVYRTFGAGESGIAARVEDLSRGHEGVTFHYQAKFPEVLVKIVVRDREQNLANERLAALDSEVRTRLAPELYGIDDQTLPAALGEALRAAGATMATAESCTGGLVGALVTEIAGSSAYFTGGAITYSNEEKMRQLGVAEQTLIDHGAVSEAVVIEMARGARERFGVTHAVSISGVAGPGGGSPEKPVGTVWLAVAGPRGVDTKLLSWPGSRKRIRLRAAYWALSMTMEAVRKGPSNDG